MIKEMFSERLSKLNFTKEEEFKAEQVNELIEQLEKLRLRGT